MRILITLVSSLLVGTLGSSGLAAAGPLGSDHSGLAGKTFYVEATVVSSPFFPEYQDAVLLTCFTFEEDGSWLDLEWPGEGMPPIPGVWIQHSDFPFINFTAYATWPDVGWTLVEDGVVSPGVRANNETMRTSAMVFDATNELVFYLTTQGHAVASCPL